MKRLNWLLIGLVVLCLAIFPLAGCTPKVEAEKIQREPTEIKLDSIISNLSKYKFRKYRLTPVIPLGAPGEWDDTEIGELSIARKMSTYYLYYDGGNADGVHQIGLATSTDLINWTKEPTNPVITVGIAGGWEANRVEDMTVIYFPKTGEWQMWYEGYGHGRPKVGLATSDNGIAWTKYTGNPVVPLGEEGEFDSYCAGDPAVIAYRGTYYMVYEARRDATRKTAMVGLATSSDGINWTKQGEILPHGTKPNTWTGGLIGISNLYHFGDYVLAYCAGWSDADDTAPARTGFLLTTDFINWVDFPSNPLGVIGETPEEEILFNHEEDVIYGLDWGGSNGTSLYVLPRKEGSKIPIEMLTLDSLAGEDTSTLTDCLEVSLDQIERMAITVECTYDTAATAGIKVHVVSSVDNINWDTEDWDSWTPTGFAPGATVRQTKHCDPDVRFLKVLIENLDGAHPVTDIKVTAVLGAN